MACHFKLIRIFIAVVFMFSLMIDVINGMRTPNNGMKIYNNVDLCRFSDLTKVITTDDGLDLADDKNLAPKYRKNILAFGYKLYEILQEHDYLNRFNDIFYAIRKELEKSCYYQYEFDKKDNNYFKNIIKFTLTNSNIYNICDIDTIYDILSELNNIEYVDYYLPIEEGIINVFYGIKTPIKKEPIDIYSYRVRINIFKNVLSQFLREELFHKTNSISSQKSCQYTPKVVADSIISMLEKAEGTFGINWSYMEAFIYGQDLGEKAMSLLSVFSQRLKTKDYYENFWYDSLDYKLLFNIGSATEETKCSFYQNIIGSFIDDKKCWIVYEYIDRMRRIEMDTAYELTYPKSPIYLLNNHLLDNPTHRESVVKFIEEIIK